ncbi:MAG: type II toxin-antitoxin system prevent-host-death family antitoxin [Planctomycetota bacterium]
MIVAAGEFKTKCLKLMDTVRDTGEEVVITKHGKPVAKLVPATKKKPRSLYGCMKGSVTYCGDIISPIDVEWEAEK